MRKLHHIIKKIILRVKTNFCIFKYRLGLFALNKPVKWSVSYSIFINLILLFIYYRHGVAPWIDFDNYKAFEEVTNDFGLKKDLLFFKGKIIILSSPNSKALRAKTEDLWSIRKNFIIFGYIFWKK